MDSSDSISEKQLKAREEIEEGRSGRNKLHLPFTTFFYFPLYFLQNNMGSLAVGEKACLSHSGLHTDWCCMIGDNFHKLSIPVDPSPGERLQAA